MKCKHCNQTPDFCETIDIFQDGLIEKLYCPKCDATYEVHYKSSNGKYTVEKVVEI